MTIRFTKMHGLGNDFIVLDAINQTIDLTQEKIRALSRRDTGIGFDQCLLVAASTDPTIDFFYRIYNADGQEVGQCGNGARCLARFIQYYGLTKKKSIRVATSSTSMQLQLNEDDSVTIAMEQPKLSPKEIPLLVDKEASLYQLPLENHTFCALHAINVGNPHAVIQVASLSKAPVATLGKEICEHPFFPLQTNVGFMEIIDSNHIHLRVYERGCGETMACGSGAVAAAAIGRLYYQLNEKIEIHLRGGKLQVSWPSKEGPIYLTGPASFVYEGVLFQGTIV